MRCVRSPGSGRSRSSSPSKLSGDAILKALIHDGTDVLAVSHLGRTIPARLRTAVVELFSECAIEGCHVNRHLEIDHNTPVSEQGPTALWNLSSAVPVPSRPQAPLQPTRRRRRHQPQTRPRHRPTTTRPANDVGRPADGEDRSAARAIIGSRPATLAAVTVKSNRLRRCERGGTRARRGRSPRGSCASARRSRCSQYRASSDLVGEGRLARRDGAEVDDARPRRAGRGLVEAWRPKTSTSASIVASSPTSSRTSRTIVSAGCLAGVDPAAHEAPAVVVGPLDQQDPVLGRRRSRRRPRPWRSRSRGPAPAGPGPPSGGSASAAA